MSGIQKPLNLAVIIASTREKRQGGVVARWFAREAEVREEFSLEIIDLRSTNLPSVIRNGHPKMGDYPPEIRAFADRIEIADAFVFVTPEYNHGYPASLKQALDLVYREWMTKPASFVTYGGVAGGVRAAEQLRQVLGELHMVDIRDSVMIPSARSSFDESGHLIENAIIHGQVQATLNGLAWWAYALREARANRPYPG